MTSSSVYVSIMLFTMMDGGSAWILLQCARIRRRIGVVSHRVSGSNVGRGSYVYFPSDEFVNSSDDDENIAITMISG